MSIEQTVGANLHRAREHAGLSQAEFGSAIGEVLNRPPWTRQAVSVAEKGGRAFTAVELVAIAETLDIPIADLFSQPPPDEEPPATFQLPPELQGRLTITVPEAGQLLGIGRDSAYAAAEHGDIPTLRLGRRLVVPVPKLLELVGLHPEGKP